MANEFNSGDPKGKVAYWACALVNHAKGGEHYHLSLKLTGPRRWLSVRNALQRLHSINVNFSDSHKNYYTAYKYASQINLCYIVMNILTFERLVLLKLSTV